MRADEAADRAIQRELVDAMGDLMHDAGAIVDKMAPTFGVNPSDLLALFKLDDGVPMKELAIRLSCDASFVTAVTDTLEERGLVRREPSQRDRRVKLLRLTPEGVEAKERLINDIGAQMPWNTKLSADERCRFLALIHKMLGKGSTTD
jgi:MarR family transcriptional regulator, organic hydroperoxide resistance regulator